VVVVQAADGSVGNDLFTVVGILQGVNETVDRSAALITLEDFRELFVLPRGYHEVAVNTRGRVPPPVLAATLARLAPQTDVKTWTELMPMFADLFRLLRGVLVLLWGAFVLAAGLGVANTMLMATYERQHEFGVLKALGTSPWGIVRDVLLEAVLLALAAAALGVLVGVGASWYLQQVGLDTRSLAGEFTLVGMVYDPIWRSSLTLAGVLWPVGLMGLISVLAAAYPAARSARLNPVETMHHG